MASILCRDTKIVVSNMSGNPGQGEEHEVNIVILVLNGASKPSQSFCSNVGRDSEAIFDVVGEIRVDGADGIYYPG
jgi:hypothetical protein